jgi:hypothetical protein
MSSDPSVLIKRGVRSSPKSGDFMRRPACPLWAKGGHYAEWGTISALVDGLYGSIGY